MKILALDMATKTGWATNSPAISGVESFAVRRGESPGMRYVRFQSWLTEMVAHIAPALIVYEQAHHRGGAATEVAAGFATHLQSFVARNGIEITTVHTGTIKKFATGRGNASKSQMMEAYHDTFGKLPEDDNEADAKWILEWALREFCVDASGDVSRRNN